jgi:hypothetical protein
MKLLFTGASKVVKKVNARVKSNLNRTFGTFQLFFEVVTRFFQVNNTQFCFLQNVLRIEITSHVSAETKKFKAIIAKTWKFSHRSAPVPKKSRSTSSYLKLLETIV